MNITIHKAALHRIASHAAAVVESKPANPMLGAVLITVEGDSITVTGSDLGTTIVERETALGTTDGSVAVPKSDLLTAIAAMPNAPVTIASTGDRHRLTVTSGKRIVTIPSLPADDYPKTPTWPKDGAELDMPASALARILKRTASSRNEDQSRPNLCSTLIEPRDGRLRAVGASSARMTLAEVGSDIKHFPQALVPRASGDAILSLVAEKSTDESITLIHGGHLLGVRRGKVTLVTMLSPDGYVPYDKVLPTSFITRCEVSTAALRESAAAVGLIAERVEKTSKIRFSIEPKRIALSAADKRDAKSVDEVPASTEGPPLELYINAVHLVDILGMVDSNSVAIECGAELEPVVFREVREDKSTPRELFLVMPMRA